MLDDHVNPFKFGGPVEGEYYLPRPELEKSVYHFLSNRIHVVLIGPRQFGKTSFVFSFAKIEKKGMHVHLLIFLTSLPMRLSSTNPPCKPNSKLKLRHVSKQWLSSWRPKFFADLDTISGQPSLGFSVDRTLNKDVKEMIQDVLAGLKTLGEKVVLVIDEFQKIAELDEPQ